MARYAPSLRSPIEERWMESCTQVIEVAGGWRMPAAFQSPEAELQAARERVALGDETPRGKLLVQGEEIAEAARQAFGGAPDAVGTWVEADGVELSRLRPDLLYCGTEPERLAAATEALRAVAKGLTGQLTVTDVTHGRFELRLLGPEAATLLSRVCGLDFHETRFAQGHVAQTSVAKTHQLILRADAADLPAYRLIGGRSLGAYVWDTLMEAGRDLQISPIGWHGLRADALRRLT